MMEEVLEIFREIVHATGADPVIVFEDLLTYIITGFCPNEDGTGWRYKGKDDVNKLYYKMLLACIGEYAARQKREGWCDVLGEIYETAIVSDGKRAMHEQFFTPQSISSLLATLANAQDNGKRYFLEPTCGSGRTLLPFVREYPRSFYVGEDIDSTSCRICACNLLMHGVRGLVICHDTLMTKPVHFAYAVNPEIFDTISPYHGIPHLIRKSGQNRVGYVIDKLYSKITGE